MRTIKYFIFLVIISYLFFYCTSFSNQALFNKVILPDSIATMLEKAYGHGGNTGASNHVVNLIDSENYQFVNGIYSFKGQGPHYPKKLFIYQAPDFFFFSEYIDGFSDKELFIMEYDSCAKMLKIDGEKSLVYYRIVQRYLQNEKGINYGSEIK